MFNAFNPSIDTVLSYFGLIFMSAALVMALNIVWRVEKRLDIFMKLFTIVIVLANTRFILYLLGLDASDSWPLIVSLLNSAIAVGAFFTVLEMYRIVKSASRK